jgi:hypothetical protein
MRCRTKATFGQIRRKVLFITSVITNICHPSSSLQMRVNTSEFERENFQCIDRLICFVFFFLWPGTTCKIEFRRVAVKIPSVLLFPCRPTNPTHFHLHSDVRGQNWVAVGWRRRKLQRRRGSLKRPPRAPALGRAS